jgi:hypothetical protein
MDFEFIQIFVSGRSQMILWKFAERNDGLMPKFGTATTSVNVREL